MKTLLQGGWLLLLLLSAMAHAQVNQHGRVLDAYSKEALVGASIQIPNSTHGTTTNGQGQFSFTSGATSPTLLVSYLGYEPKLVPVTANQQDIYLTPALNQINQVIVSASRAAQIRSEAPVAISSITSQVLQETKAVTLDQVLNKVSGVYMVNLGNEQHTMAIRQPIGYKSLFLYLEDGIPIRTSGDFNHNALIEVNMAALKTIEVIKGPASSLYGSEAIGGAVNFITKAPSAMLTGQVQVEASSRGYRRTDFSVSNTFGKLGVYAGGYYAVQRNGFMSHSDFDKLAFTLRTDYTFNPRTQLTTTASLVDYDTDQTGGLDSTRFHKKDYSSLHTFSYRQVKALRLRSTLDHTWNASHHTQATVFFRNNTIGQNPFYAISNVKGDNTRANGEINEDGFSSYGFIGQHRTALKFWDARLTAGASLDVSPATYTAHYLAVDRNEQGTYTGFIATDSLLTHYAVDLLNTAVYAQLEMTPLDRLKLVAALRYDRLDYAFDNFLTPSAFTGAPDEKNGFRQFSPKLGLTYSLTNNLGLYANYSVGFAPPQITELYRGVKVPHLKSSDYRSYETGFWWSFWQHRAYSEVSFYQMDGTNEIIATRQDDGSYQNQNAGQTRHRGLEYALTVKPDEQLSMSVSGTNAWHQFVKYVEKGQDYSGNRMATAPGFLANAEAIYKPHFLPNLRLSLEWQHVGAYFMDPANTEKYQGYDLLHTRVGYALKGFEIWANLLNLTNTHYATTVDKYAYGKSYRTGLPMTLHVGVGYQFAANPKK